MTIGRPARVRRLLTSLNLKVGFRAQLMVGVLLLLGAAAGVALYVYERGQQSTAFLTARVEQEILERAQAEVLQGAREESERVSRFFEDASADVLRFATATQAVLDRRARLADSTYWSASQALFRLPTGSWSNSSGEPSSIFLPAASELTLGTQARLNALKHLELSVPTALLARPDVMAMYFGGASGEVLYFPNNNLASLVRPDFAVTAQSWYAAASPAQNPQGSVVWSEPYLDAGGSGLVVTAAMPVVDSDGVFQGVAALDLQLARLGQIAAGDSPGRAASTLLLDGSGRLVAVSVGAYENLGIAPADVPVGSPLDAVNATALPAGLLDLAARMRSGQSGVATLLVDGTSSNVAFTQIEPAAYSLALVASPVELISAAATTRQQVAAGAVQTSRVVLLLLLITLCASLVAVWYFGGRVVGRWRKVVDGAGQIAAGELESALQVGGADEVAALARSLNLVAARVRELSSSAPHGDPAVAGFEARSARLQTHARVARLLSAQLELSPLLAQAAQLLSVEFSLADAAVFLADDRREFLILEAESCSSGEPPRQPGFRLRLDSTSLAGSAVSTGRASVLSGTGARDLVEAQHEFPEPFYAAALPLILDGETIGALELRSLGTDGLGADNLAALGLVADQLAVAIKNARLFEKGRTTLEDARREHGERTRDAWLRLLREEEPIAYVATSDGALERQALVEPLAEHEGELAPDTAGAAIDLPINVRGQAIGSLRLKKRDGAAPWSIDDITLARALTDQLAGALEGARLYKEAQQLAARETLVSQISAKIASAPRVDGILEETVRELGKALGGAAVSFRLTPPARSAEGGLTDPAVEATGELGSSRTGWPSNGGRQ